MKRPAINPYLQTQIRTASPDELRLMLYDGCLKFARQAKAELTRERPDFEAVYENFMRAQKIVLELSTGLNRDAAPELCDKLAGLYTYIYRLLVDANVDRDPAKIDEAIELLDYERQTWQLYMEKAAASGPAPDPTGAQQTAISSLSKSA
ncbi:MAG: flagellar export chaperone FliS [Planctomycetota bacterium]